MTPPFIARRLIWFRWPVASLRAYFLTLIILATVPLALLASLLIGEQINTSEDQLHADLARAAGSVALMVEREIASSTDALSILSFSDPLQRGDIAGIFSSLSALPVARHSWRSVFLVNLQGEVLFNTRQPASEPLGKIQDMAALAKLKSTGQPVVTDLIKGPDGHFATGILVPVFVKGDMAYALGAWIHPSSWRRLILPNEASSSTAIISIFDAHKHIIARNIGGDAVISLPLPAQTQAQMADRSHAGTGMIGTLEGGEAYGAWKTIAGSPWGVVIGEQAAPIDRAHRLSILSSVGIGILSVLAGLTLSMLLARRLTDPLRRLAEHGPDRTSGQRNTIQELQQLESALAEAQHQREVAREKLQAKTYEFEAIFQSSAVGLAVTQTPSCETILFNPALANMLGEPVATTKGADFSRSAWPNLEIWRDGKRMAPEKLPLQRAAQTGQIQRDVELEIHHTDGRVLRLIAQAIPLFNVHGYTRGAFASFTDITDIKRAELELMQAERRLRESQYLIELAQAAGQVGFFNHHLVTGTVSWTSGLSRLFGLPPTPFEGPWAHWIRHIHPQDRRTVLDAIRHITQQQASRGSLDFRTLLDDQSERWLSSRIQISYDANGTPIDMTGVLVDITQQKSVDRERAALVERETSARQEAEKANSAKDEFLAMLGHELRNPLGAISAGCEVLTRSENNSAMSQRARQIITRQTHHLGRLMDDLLDVARVISGKILLTRQTVRLDELLQRVIHTFDIAGQLTGHHIETHLQPVWVSVDLTRMEQVMTNLLSNALKYTPEGGHVTLSVKQVNGDVFFTVQDTGMGMSPELKSRAFDLFVQGERTLDRRQGGLGIGLTLVRRLTELHGGHISVDSEGPNQGCTFTLRMPASAPEAGAADLQPSTHPLRRKVVVVEDNEDAREALTAMLTLDGHATQSADNGRAGLALILSAQPDIALVDIGLPEINGYELAHQLRQNGYSGWLVALSGYGQAEDIDRSIQAGFDDHIVKPVNPSKLQNLLAQHSTARTATYDHHQGQQNHSS